MIAAEIPAPCEKRVTFHFTHASRGIVPLPFEPAMPGTDAFKKFLATYGATTVGNTISDTVVVK